MFIVASLDGAPWDVIFPDHSLQSSELVPSIDKPIGFYWTEGTYATGLAANALPPLKGGSTIGIPSPPAILFPSGKVATPDIRDAERMQGFPTNWTSPATANGKPSDRWKLVGNAVTVNVTQWLARQLKSPKHFECDRNDPINGTWPPAAWGGGKEGRFKATVGQSLCTPKIIGLDTFLRFEPKPLSNRATVGFISRVRAGNLRFPDGFIGGLERHAQNTKGR